MDGEKRAFDRGANNRCRGADGENRAQSRDEETLLKSAYGRLLGRVRPVPLRMQ